MQSMPRKPRRWLTHNEKGKKKTSDYDTYRNESDRRESACEKSDDRSSRENSASAKKASTSTNL